MTIKGKPSGNSKRFVDGFIDGEMVVKGKGDAKPGDSKPGADGVPPINVHVHVHHAPGGSTKP